MIARFLITSAALRSAFSDDQGFGPGASVIALGTEGRFIYSTNEQAQGMVSVLDILTNSSTGVTMPVQSVPGGLQAIAEPETNFSVQALRNRSVLQYGLYNRITWTNPVDVGWTPLFYVIYRDKELTDIVDSQVPTEGVMVFDDQERAGGVTYEYYLVAVDTNNIVHVLATQSVTSE